MRILVLLFVLYGLFSSLVADAVRGVALPPDNRASIEHMTAVMRSKYGNDLQYKRSSRWDAGFILDVYNQAFLDSSSMITEKHYDPFERSERSALVLVNGASGQNDLTIVPLLSWVNRKTRSVYKVQATEAQKQKLLKEGLERRQVSWDIVKELVPFIDSRWTKEKVSSLGYGGGPFDARCVGPVVAMDFQKSELLFTLWLDADGMPIYLSRAIMMSVTTPAPPPYKKPPYLVPSIIQLKDGGRGYVQQMVILNEKIDVGDSWKIEILNDRAKVIKAFSGTGRPPEKLDWEGRTDEGGLLPKGHYMCRIIGTREPYIDNSVVTRFIVTQ